MEDMLAMAPPSGIIVTMPRPHVFDDGTARAHQRQDEIGQMPRPDEIDLHDIERRTGLRQAGAIEQCVDATANAGNGGIDRFRIAQVGATEGGELEGAILVVQTMNFGAKRKQQTRGCFPHAGETAADNDPFTVVAEQIRHQSFPCRHRRLLASRNA